jgi:hypothetical protein
MVGNWIFVNGGLLQSFGLLESCGLLESLEGCVAGVWWVAGVL